MGRYRTRRGRGIAYAAAALVAVASPDALAQHFNATWLHLAGGTWTDAARWSSDPFYPNDGNPTGRTYAAHVGAPVTVTLNSDVTVHDLIMSGTPEARLDITAGTLNIAGFADVTRCTVAINGGAYRGTVSTTIGHTGTLDVRAGSGSVALLASNFGTIDVSGGQLIAGTFTQAFGRINVSGSGEFRAHRGSTITGSSTINLSGGTLALPSMYAIGNVQFNHTGGVADLYPLPVLSDGPTYRLSGGTLVLGYGMAVGYDGAATFTHTGGMILRRGDAQPLAVGSGGSGRPSAGTFLIDGPDARFVDDTASASAPRPSNVVGIGSLAHGTMTIRNGAVADLSYAQVGVSDGTGTLLIDSGARVTMIALSVGDGSWRAHGSTHSRGTGTVIVDGAATRVTIDAGTLSDSIRIGSSQAVAPNAGTLILRGGTVTAGATLAQRQGTLILDGATFRASALGALGGAIRFESGSMDLGNLVVGAPPFGGRFTITPGGDKVVRTRALTINGHLDVTDNHVIVDYTGLTSPVTDVRVAAQRGIVFNSAGPGLYSSLTPANPGFGIGYAEASALFDTFPATFAGQPVDATTVIVTYTRYGDANLDEFVNLSDFNRLAANFGGTNRFWSQGDFNYDGNVNLTDFNLLAANFGLGAAGPTVTAQDWAALAAAVPEPGAAAGLACGVAFAAARRRRQFRVA